MILVQEDDFQVDALYKGLLKANETGAVAMFVGLVRQFSDLPNGACHFELEHYPGMTERNLQTIVDEANARWPLLDVCVVHRVGRLSVDDQIVFVGVSAAHRADAFQACDFIMDYLKSRAAFWKKESQGSESHWVEANTNDEKSLERW
ncbi:molybdenum cofactor biosynthesis protein MoaE [Marinomonas sp. M1K-6]|uniref:Molybdopterin synthase catalytic subunit n=1 Tax=Marinomonas profundi TaxID=2726122 RepID=A0A847R605_9GAMM|nr:molybdenum cofactor biosynthesis protein MoaE [Marinomonas profundi]NLQ16314.1 molybdenum cofactor biosynthesis protein MoaE [Marinomonas profundi]UDV03110.1 molybdenum cofactor biosynthesis protein MoaE [Marinomonas profundi]